MARVRRAGLALLAVISLATAIVGIGTIAAAADEGGGGVHYQFIVGSGPLCELGVPDACPDVSAASNGDTLAFAGSGTFTTGSDEASGSGTFVHSSSDGTVIATGTWNADELRSFTSYGGNAAGLPANFEGGLARLEISLHPNGSERTLEANLLVDCAINSPLNPPREGVMVSVDDGPNFATEVSGITIFINLGSAGED